MDATLCKAISPRPGRRGGRPSIPDPLVALSQCTRSAPPTNKELSSWEGTWIWSGTQKLGDLGDPINVTGRARLTPDGAIVYVWRYGTVQSEGYLPQRVHPVSHSSGEKSV